MSWQAITTDNIKTRLTGPEVSALQTSALASGQSDPLPEIVEHVVDEARGYIAAGGFSLETGSTIPSKLVSAVLAIIRYRLATRLPVKSLLTDERKEENAAAIRLLERVADGRFAIEEPETADGETLAARTPSMTTPDLDFDPDSQEGV